MKNIGQRILAVLLCVVLCTSMLVVPVAAADPITIGAFIAGLGKAADAWNSIKEALGIEDLNQIALQFNKDITGQSGTNYRFTRPSTAPGREFVDLDNADILYYLSQDWNSSVYNHGVLRTGNTYSYFGVYVSEAKFNGVKYQVLRVNGQSSKNPAASWYLCDGLGHIIRAPIDAVTVSAPHYLQLKQIKGAVNTQPTLSVMERLADTYEGYISDPEAGLIYVKNSATSYLCDPDGLPYAYLDPNSSAASTDRGSNVTNVTEQYVTEEGDTITNNYDQSTNNDFSWVFDNENGIVVAPGGIAEIIDKVFYDQTTQTYHIDSHDIYDNRTYYTFQFHINYTNITYIGATEEYNKYYKTYYELPDGRNSADLTAQELEQLNISMDVIPYGRSTKETEIRALYHFDGDTKDSSYWNYCSSFTWNEGASLTYMESGDFEGALYLDEQLHSMTMRMPTNFASSDFTIQFRYYQSNTLAPVNDSFIALGSSVLYRMDGSHFLRGSTVKIPIPTGSWNEVAIMRKNGTMYFYLNGICYDQVANTKSYDNRLSFRFGADQQTYKYLDELRVLNFAIASGENYTPTDVPYDSNLTLVLPDSAVPVPDEYWQIESSKPNLFEDNFANLYEVTDGTFMPVTYTHTDLGDIYIVQEDADVPWRYNPNKIEIVNDGKSTKFRYHLTSFVYNPYYYGVGGYYTTNGYWYHMDTVTASNALFCDVLLDCSLANTEEFNVYEGGYPYTFSIVNEDGEVASITITDESDGKNISAFGYKFGYFYVDKEILDGDYPYTVRVGQFFICPITSNPDGLVYMELVQGDSTDLTAKWTSTVTPMTPDQMKTPTLAVKTDLEINTYQIGGVRPSIPSKGDVYAMVQSGYITSLQIYTGSAWEAVDGRIWTGSRWIPYSSYNVITLQDMYDIVDATEDWEYIYDESGFYDWLQRALNKITDKLDQIIAALTGSDPNDPAKDCQHVYDSRIDLKSTCTEPGHKVLTCQNCGHTFTELLDPVGHDWVISEHIDPVVDEEGNVIEEGYDIMECTVCGVTGKDYGEGILEDDIWEALGDFISEGITWILDKLTELVDALRGVTDGFNSFIDRVGQLGGSFPLFLAGFFAIIPEDLSLVLWFSVACLIVLAVWCKWSK